MMYNPLIDFLPSTASVTGIPMNDAKSSPLIDEYAWATKFNALFLVDSENGRNSVHVSCK